MQIELTVRAAGQTTDLAVRSPGPVTFDRLRAEIERLTAVPAGATWWRGRDRLHPESIVGTDLLNGAVIDAERRADGGPAGGLLSLHQVGGPGAGRIFPLGRGRLTVGRDAGCDIPVADPDASRRHAGLQVTDTAVTVHDLQSTNGTEVEGDPVPPAGRPVRPGERIRIGDSTFLITAPTNTPATVQDSGAGTLQVLRPPRRLAPISADTIEVPTRSGTARPRGVQWAAALAPAAVGVAIAWFAQSPQFLLFGLLSPVVLISTSLSDRLHWRRSRRLEAATYAARRRSADAQIAAALAHEAAQRHAAAPDPAQLRLIAAVPSTRLWERRRADPDFLSVRIGTADLPSTVCHREGSHTAPAGQLSGVPLCVDLRSGPLGIAAPVAVVEAVARSVVAQLAVLHSPADVELVLLLSRPDSWRWCRWLPHWHGQVATTAREVARVVAELTEDVDRRLAARRRPEDGRGAPWRVVIVDRSSALSDVPGLAALLAHGPAAGITAVCVDDDPAALPSACTSGVRAVGVTGHRAVLHTGGRRQPDVVLDTVSPEWAEGLARDLARLADAESDAAALPDACSLLPVLGLEASAPDSSSAAALAAAIIARWARSDGSAAAPIGVGADGPLSFDLTADGPHALVAGTTGAGKSELLRSIVAGIAAHHPPDLINVLLIDYKGGATFAECARLPHCSGLVTDLDPFLTSRALRSLDSELRRREQLFADAGVADLAAFRTRRSDESLPRLLIVVDEFATLADELPDFLRGLVGVAQRGRSLGVHLILATQRPGSAITPEIRANTSLRLALRVTDPGESTDVIDAPDAALIDRRCPGRGYLRSGTALTAFQAAHTGHRADTASEPVLDLLDEWARPTSDGPAPAGTTELELLVDAVELAWQARRMPRARSTWLPPLEHRIPRPASVAGGAQHGVDAHPGADRSTGGTPTPRLPYAVADLPDQQRRDHVHFDLGGATLLFVGASGSGRTEALAGLAASAAERSLPTDLHLYVIDADGRLADAVRGLPHAATVIGPRDLDLVPALLTRLAGRRVEENGVGAAGPTPVSLLLIDGWDALSSALPDIDALACADVLATILRNAGRDRLSVAVTGGRGCLAPRFAANFETKILLRLTDVTDYGIAGIGARSVPTRFVPGRGIRAADGAEVQLFCVADGQEPDRLRAAVHRAATRGDPTTVPPAVRAAAGRGPIRLRPLPARILLEEIPVPRRQSAFVLGVGGDAALPVLFDVAGRTGRFLVAGPPRSGRTSVLRSLLHQALRAQVAVAVAAPVRSALRHAATVRGVPLVGPEDSAATVEVRVGAATLVLVDDCEVFLDCPAGDALVALVREQRPGTVIVAAGRSDELATSYRGIGAVVRRDNCGLLLRPGPVDGELLGTRLPRRPSSGPPGRGVVIGLALPDDPYDSADNLSYGLSNDVAGDLAGAGEPVPVQIALPPDHAPRRCVPQPDPFPVADADADADQPMCGYR